MKLFGAALFSLAVFRICATNVSTDSNSATSSTPVVSVSTDSNSATRSTPIVSVSTDSNSATSNAPIVSVSTDSNSATSSAPIVSVASTAPLESDSQTKPLQPSEMVTASSPSITEASDKTSSTEKTESLPGSTVTAFNSTWTMTGLSNSTTTSESKKSVQESISNVDRPSRIPGTRTNPTGSSANTTSTSSTDGNFTEEDSFDAGSTGRSVTKEDYSGIILPVVIALIVITLSVFVLVALYKMCKRRAPERQENGTERAPTDKEGVKLLSVKTTSPETGEHSSEGKYRTHQHDESSHLGNKHM